MTDLPVAPKGVRQRDFNLGYRACEADLEGQGEALLRATELAERYGNAILRIGAALDGTPGGVMRARTIIAGLDELARAEDCAASASGEKHS